MTRMFNPPHPGEALKDGVFSDTGITVTQAAKALRITRAALSRIVDGKAGISAEMALRLGQWLGTGPEIWLNMQSAYDLWQAEQRPRPRIEPLAVGS
ncbi:MAG: HigA family addiction module antitoxin [Gammaproteobacteria bacterium]